MFILQCQQA